METHQIMNLAFLTLMGTAIAGSYFVANRHNLSKMVQQAAIWVLIFIGAIGAIGMWGQISQTILPQQSFISTDEVAVPRSADGHYYLTLEVNQIPIEFVIDTGATQIVLSQDDAATIGLDPSDLRFIGSANTANGIVQTAPVRLDTVALGAIVDQNVPAVVNGGQMDGSLLGMSYLSGFSGIAIRNDELILTR